MSPESASTTLIILFRGCNNPLAFQQHNETFGHGHYSTMGWPWTHQKMLHETGVDSSSLLPVYQHVVALVRSEVKQLHW